MNFIQSTFLYALAGLAIPVIIHLIFRWQVQRVDLGTTRFLSELLRETARRRKVKRWLLLCMRLACIALFALLFARPYLQADQLGQDGTLKVFLIDQSASMSLRTEGQRLVEVAVDRVKQELKRMSPKVRYEVAFFDSEIHVFGALDKEASIKDLKAPDQAFGGTSYGRAFAWARDICLKSNDRQREVYVYTDLQRSGLDWTDLESFPEDVRVQVEDLGRDNLSNVGIVRGVPSQTLIRPDDSVEITTTLFNFGVFDLDEVPVILTLTTGDKTIRQQELMTLPAEQATEVEFEIQSLGQGAWQGDIQLDLEDDYTFDNRHHLMVLSQPQKRVLVVDGTRESGAAFPETFFLERAIGLAASGEKAEESPFVVTHCTYEEQGLANLDQTDIVILANVGDLSAADAHRLLDFVQQGGALQVFTGENMTASGCQRLEETGLTPGKLLEVRRTRDLPFRWEDWDDTSSMLDIFSDPQNGDLHLLAFSAYTKVSVRDDVRVLAKFSGGDPGLTLHTVGQGRVCWFLSTCSRQWGDWARSRLYVPIVHLMLGDLVNLTAGGPVQNRAIDSTQFLVNDGDPQSMPERPGIVGRNRRWHVMNVVSRESEPERCSLEELSERFQFEYIPEDDEGTPRVRQASIANYEVRQDEIWHWIACVLIGVLCLEWFISNRTTA